jgi:xanthine dehydrogenase accessory factor
MESFSATLALIKGAGDLATGVAARLHRSGFPVVMTELPNPLMVRRTVAFGEAVYEREVAVEGIRARRVSDVASARAALLERVIPVLVDPQTACLAELAPTVLIDAIMAKHNTGTRLSDAAIVVALGPGFAAGVDCHAVIETNRGHRLGRAIYEGGAEPDTGRPGRIAGRTDERIIRAPVSGVIEDRAAIGDRVVEGQIVASVGGQEVSAGCSGVLRGLVRPGAFVPAGEKIGDVDPRADPSHCYLISDKALAIAGGVLEAILHLEAGTHARATPKS